MRVVVDRIPQIKPQKLIKILEKFGFVVRRQTGSHIILRHPVRRNFTVVPMHARNIKRALLFGILKQAEISHKDFLKMLQ